MSAITTNRTIAKNTLFLYGRLLFNLVVSLYTSRVLLQVIGVSDLGIYQVVAGIITMFTFVNGSLAGATSRFLAFELAKNDMDKLKQTFAAILNVHLLVAICIFILGETIGTWLVNTKLVIPTSRIFAANVVFQCSILMTVLSLIQIPYNSSIIAHEKMSVFAYIGILDTLLKLVACFILVVVPFDHLIIYGIVLLVFTVLINAIYYIYSKRNFKECCFQRISDRRLIKSILIFSGWDLYGNFGLIIKNQGVNILSNMFFGVIVNAACGFANTIYAAIAGFANNFMISIRPAITKAYSIKEYDRMNDLITQSAKLSFCMILLFIAPFLFDCEYILLLWLKTPPLYTANLCRLTLLILLVVNLFSPLVYAINATGNNKLLQIIHGTSLLLILPITYVFFRLGSNPYVPFIITLLVEIVKCLCYAPLLKKVYNNFDIRAFFKGAVLPCFSTAAIVFLLSFLVYVRWLNKGGFIQLIGISFTTSILTIGMSWLIILSRGERKIITDKIQSLRKRIWK